jgi:peptidoglycan/xylan/chitin deacetylase (PgdA/CDA1 family)
VYLTFDDGPEYDHFSKAIAETLAGEGIQATFFLLGTVGEVGALYETISNLESDVVAIRDAGHAIGIHGWSHRPWNSFPEYLDEIKMTHQALTNALGTLDDKLLRSPEGAFAKPPYPGYEEWYYYHWSIDPADGYYFSAKEVVDNVKGAIGAGPDSANVLLHSNRPGTHKAIVEPEGEAEDLIKVFKDAGYTEFKKLPRPGDSPGIILH